MVWGIFDLGGTGLILYNPVASSLYMHGWVLNMVLWVHRIEAILAMFEGSVDLEAARHERPAWVARLEQSGRLESQLVAEAPDRRRALFYIFGYAAIAVGLLLAGLSIAHPSPGGQRGQRHPRFFLPGRQGSATVLKAVLPTWGVAPNCKDYVNSCR